MEFFISEKKFKDFSKNLKKLINEFNGEFSLGATQNLLARTFGYKDYNTIVPTLKEYNQVSKAIGKTDVALEELRKIVDEHEQNKNFNINSNNKLNEISYTLFSCYKFAISQMDDSVVLTFDENFYLDSQNTLYLELINTVSQAYYLTSTNTGKILSFDFLEKIKQMNIQRKHKEIYLEPLSKVILNTMHSINLLNINEKSTKNYINQFEAIFSEIIIFGLIYLGKEKTNKILETVSKGLQENNLELPNNFKI